MASSANDVPWWDILSGVSSTIAVIIFITGRESLAALLGLRKPNNQATKQRSKRKQGRLSHSLNKPGALLVGLVFFMIAIGSFLMPPRPSSVINDNSYIDNSTINITSTKEVTTSKNDKLAPSTSNKTIAPAKPTVTPLTGIEILNADNSVNAGASQQLSNIIIDKPNPPVIQGRLLAATPIVFDNTATTKILAYKVSLTLKIYRHDGMHLCNTRFFETTIHADDITSVDKIKQQAMATFSHEMAKNPAIIKCQ